jgi:Cu/Ag efflux protein CusF
MNTITKLGLMVLVAAFTSGANAAQQTTGNINEKSWTGTLTAVDPQYKTVAGRNWWWFTKTFNVGDNCAISAVDKQEAALGDLRPGEKVKIRYQDVDGVLVSDNIAELALRYGGTVQAFDRKAGTLTVEQDAIILLPYSATDRTPGTLTMDYEPVHRTVPFHKKFGIADDCKVILNNGNIGTIADLKPGDKVTVIYELPGGSPVAYRVRENSLKFVGAIDAIDLPERTVKARAMLSEMKFNLADGCRIFINGSQTAQLKDLELGRKYQFTYENVNGVYVVNWISPAHEPRSAETASTR